MNKNMNKEIVYFYSPYFETYMAALDNPDGTVLGSIHIKRFSAEDGSNKRFISQSAIFKDTKFATAQKVRVYYDVNTRKGTITFKNKK